MNTILAGVLAYLIGSVSFAVVVSKLFGLSDPRTYGSKNPGATNVLRSGNKAAAVLTLGTRSKAGLRSGWRRVMRSSLILMMAALRWSLLRFSSGICGRYSLSLLVAKAWQLLLAY
jgi:hypothetical protein